jgi:hypothetical protein
MPHSLRERFAPAWEQPLDGPSQFDLIGRLFSFSVQTNFECAQIYFKREIGINFKLEQLSNLKQISSLEQISNLKQISSLEQNSNLEQISDLEQISSLEQNSNLHKI